MAMASAAAVAVSSSAALLASSSQTRCISTVPQERTCAVFRASSAARGAVVVKCAVQDDVSREERSVSRREVFSLATLSVLLLSADKAQAKDIPLFGIRKQLETAEKGVKDLAAQGGKGLEAVSASVQGAVSDIDVGVPSVPGLPSVGLPSVPGLSPILQAGGVIGAEAVAVLVAASVVKELVTVPSK